MAEAERQEMRGSVRNSAKFCGNRFLAASKVIKDVSLFSGGGALFGGEGHNFFPSCLGEGHNFFKFF